jgi:ferritin-like metal-binding protein YciE
VAECTTEEHLVKYLTDAHAIEIQAIAQLKLAPKIAEEPGLAKIYETHLKETERQERLVRERLEAHDASPSRVKDAGMGGRRGFRPVRQIAARHPRQALRARLLVRAPRACRL